jgi:hypothetical protein
MQHSSDRTSDVWTSVHICSEVLNGNTSKTNSFHGGSSVADSITNSDDSQILMKSVIIQRGTSETTDFNFNRTVQGILRRRSLCFDRLFRLINDRKTFLMKLPTSEFILVALLATNNSIPCIGSCEIFHLNLIHFALDIPRFTDQLN